MKKYLLLAATAVAALFFSCELPIPTLNLTSEDTMSFSADGGSGTIHYSLTGTITGSNVVATADSWITDLNYATAGRVTFNVTPNQSTSARTGKVTIVYSTISVDVTINQAGKSAEPDQPGGDEPGGDEPDQPGGDEPDQPGGDEPGGDEPGGDEPGGDEPFTPDVTWKATQIHGSYMGDAGGYYKSNSYSLYLSDNGIQAGNMPEKPNSTYMHVSFYSDEEFDEETRQIPYGTYTYDATKEDVDGNISKYSQGFYQTNDKGYMEGDNYKFASGTMTVSPQGILIEMTDNTGVKREITYQGTPTLNEPESDEPGGDEPGGDEPDNNDKTITFGETDAIGGYFYDPEEISADYAIWQLMVEPTSGNGYGMEMQIYTFDIGFDESNIYGDYISWADYESGKSGIPFIGVLYEYNNDEVVDEIEMTGGLVISGEGDKLVLTYEDDERNFVWKDIVTWYDESTGGGSGGDDEYVERTDAVLNGWYDGIVTAGDNDYHYYDIWLSNGGVTKNENDKVQISTNSWYYETILLIDKAPVNGRIPNGTYEMTGSIAYNTVYAGQVVETGSSSITYNEMYAGAVMQVTDNGIVLEVIDETGKYHVVSYTGNNYTLEGEYGDGGDDPDQPGGDDEEDVWNWEIDVFQADVSYWGNSNWYIELLPESGEGIILDFVASEDGLSADLSGTYAPANDHNTPMTYLEGYIQDGYVFGSNLVQVQENGLAVLPMEDNNVEITANSDGTYSIYYSAYNSNYGYTFVVDWTGYLNKQDRTPNDFEYEAPHIAGTIRGTASNGNTVYGIQLDNMVDSNYGDIYYNSYAYHISIALPNAPENPICFDAPAGTYEVVNNNDWATGTAVVQYRQADDTEVIRNVKMVSGSVTIDENGVAALDMVDENGNSHSVTYSGSTHIDAVNSDMEGDYTPDETFTGVMDISDWGDLDATGQVANAKSTKYVQLPLGDQLGVLVFSDTEAVAEGEIATGTYTIKHVGVGSSISEKTVWAGEGGNGIYYSFVGNVTPDGYINGFHLLDSGTVTVSKSGEEYTIEVDGYNEDPHSPKKIQYTWKGTAPAAAQVGQPSQGVAKIAPEVNMVTKTSAKVNADMKKAKKPVRKANKKVKAPKKEVRRLEDVKREFIVR